MVNTIVIGKDDIFRGFTFLDEMDADDKVKFFNYSQELSTKMSFPFPKADLIYRKWSEAHAKGIPTHDARVKSAVLKLRDCEGWKD